MFLPIVLFEEMQCLLGLIRLWQNLFAQVMEKTQSRDAAKQFLDDMPNKNGVAYSDGPAMLISRDASGKKIITITFHDQEWVIDETLLDDIISDRDAWCSNYRCHLKLNSLLIYEHHHLRRLFRDFTFLASRPPERAA